MKLVAQTNRERNTFMVSINFTFYTSFLYQLAVTRTIYCQVIPSYCCERLIAVKTLWTSVSISTRLTIPQSTGHDSKRKEHSGAVINSVSHKNRLSPF